jgi:eukaryotic-like serine/threonine-protein kinase
MTGTLAQHVVESPLGETQNRRASTRRPAVWHVAARITSVVLAAVLVMAAEPVGFVDDASQAGPAPPPEVLRLPDGWQLNRGSVGPMRTELALSPDGTSVVFSATPDGTMEKARLYRRYLDRPDAALVPGTPEGVCMPVFSPDGRWIAYWVAEKIYKVPVDGGSPVALADIPARPVGMSWGPDGRIFLGQLSAGLQYVPANGGTPQTLTTVDPAAEGTHRLPHVAPGGKGLLFTAMQSNIGLENRLEWLSLETGKRTLIVEDAGDGRYLPTGHVVFVRKGTLMAIPFDVARLRTTGRAVTVMPRLLHAFNSPMRDMHSGAGQYSVSESGALIWVSGGVVPDFRMELHWVDRSGRAELWSAFGTRPVNAFRLSPDGSRVAFAAVGLEERGTFVYDIQRNRTTRLTPDASSYFVGPFWSADGKQVAFSRYQGTYDLWWAPADGASEPRLLSRTSPAIRGGSWQRGGSWTHDGKFLAYVEGESVSAGLDIKVLRMADRQVVAFAATKAAEMYPEFSPDGRWMAYVSNETGRNEVYVRSFPDGRRTLQVTSEGGTSPMWSPDGRELFYYDVGFKTLTKVDISAGETVSLGTPRTLFEFSALATAANRVSYDITPDGQRFLILKSAPARPAPTVTELHLERNWFDRLKRIGTPSSH